MKMTFEIVMGLHVIDDEEYQKYREEMEPILNSVGGSFGFDFKIATVLRSKTDEKINRVFTIEFPSKKIMDEFFSNPEYLSVKNKHFNSSVKTRTEIAMYEKNS
jgi:uncharacterized protein (DUF1330 family)